MRTPTLPRVVAPLFSPPALLPMGEPGGVAYPMSHIPGELRPYAASLAVPMPLQGKHNTTSTSPRTSMATETSSDGKVSRDSQTDTGSDS
ncbi:hypothetical protein ACGFIP_04530 [Micromonospora zamorensis]|uniref:Uncharacterized protein n=3 Tax=Micromonospora TaxID=1873 RepID=A0A3N9WUR1_9ACTN|nr:MULTISPECIES: hypothetical protein [Micromonospora]RQW99270.1 hypothetical protein DLJ59_25095 [Micromonospora inaquosa]RQX04480.1 hypothetical protein DLJ58_27480 [Micromonospora arida]WSK48402.1 hypothetical protein OG423_31220 [Micromonospora zamorensis]